MRLDVVTGPKPLNGGRRNVRLASDHPYAPAPLTCRSLRRSDDYSFPLLLSDGGFPSTSLGIRQSRQSSHPETPFPERDHGPVHSDAPGRFLLTQAGGSLENDSSATNLPLR